MKDPGTPEPERSHRNHGFIKRKMLLIVPASVRFFYGVFIVGDIAAIASVCPLRIMSAARVNEKNAPERAPSPV